MQRLKAIFIILNILSAGSFSYATEKTVTIAGDPCSIPLITKLSEGYVKKNKDFKVEVSTFACTYGVYKAASGEFEVGVSTQNGLSSNLPKGANNTVIAKSPIVLIVNRKNPVGNLTFKQAQDMFSGKIRNWKDVGGLDMDIKNVMLEPCVKHTLSKQVILYGESITLLTPDKKGNPVEYTNRLVAEDAGSIGQQIYGYETPDVKVLKIDGVLPDEKTLSTRAYTFYQDFNVVTLGEPGGSIKELIDFAYTPEGKDIIRSVKHIPLSR